MSVCLLSVCHTHQEFHRNLYHLQWKNIGPYSPSGKFAERAKLGYFQLEYTSIWNVLLVQFVYLVRLIYHDITNNIINLSNSFLVYFSYFGPMT